MRFDSFINGSLNRITMKEAAHVACLIPQHFVEVFRLVVAPHRINICSSAGCRMPGR
jgi:hypothetical protein